MNTEPRAATTCFRGSTGAAVASRAPADTLAKAAVPTTVCFTNCLLLISSGMFCRPPALGASLTQGENHYSNVHYCRIAAPDASILFGVTHSAARRELFMFDTPPLIQILVNTTQRTHPASDPKICSLHKTGYSSETQELPPRAVTATEQACPG